MTDEQRKLAKEIIDKLSKASNEEFDSIINLHGYTKDYPIVEKVEWEHLLMVVISFSDSGVVWYFPKDARGEQMIHDQRLNKEI